MSDTQGWPGGVAAITLFVEDLDAARSFYQKVFGLPIHYEEENSAVFEFGATLVNLLQATEAPALIEPARVASRDAGVRFQFTLGVDDVDSMADRPVDPAQRGSPAGARLDRREYEPRYSSPGDAIR
jgi:catechol 2,3-dioxygenase-like lactoylglutathione lyase family enzyme